MGHLLIPQTFLIWGGSKYFGPTLREGYNVGEPTYFNGQYSVYAKVDLVPRFNYSCDGKFATSGFFINAWAQNNFSMAILSIIKKKLQILTFLFSWQTSFCKMEENAHLILVTKRPRN